MFGWTEAYAIGVPNIDAQHKQLFVIISDLHQAMKTGQSKLMMGQTLDKLVDYTVRHFNAEEALLKTKGYTELAQHKLIHDQFTARMKKFQEDHRSGALMVNVGLMDTLQKWLVEHVQGTDRKYARDLKL